MKDKIKFDELLKMEWKYSNDNDKEDLQLQIFDKTQQNENDQYKGVLITFEQCWADHKPTSHYLSEEDINTVSNMFLYTKEMYKLLLKLDNVESKELMQKINSKL